MITRGGSCIVYVFGKKDFRLVIPGDRRPDNQCSTALNMYLTAYETMYKYIKASDRYLFKLDGQSPQSAPETVTTPD